MNQNMIDMNMIMENHQMVKDQIRIFVHDWNLFAAIWGGFITLYYLFYIRKAAIQYQRMPTLKHSEASWKDLQFPQAML